MGQGMLFGRWCGRVAAGDWLPADASRMAALHAACGDADGLARFTLQWFMKYRRKQHRPSAEPTHQVRRLADSRSWFFRLSWLHSTRFASSRSFESRRADLSNCLMLQLSGYVQSVRAGSVVVDFVILPAANGRDWSQEMPTATFAAPGVELSSLGVSTKRCRNGSHCVLRWGRARSRQQLAGRARSRQQPHAEPEAGNSSHAEPEAGNSSHAEPEAGNSSHAEPEAGNSSHAEPEAGNSSQAEPEAGNSSQAERKQATARTPSPKQATARRTAGSVQGSTGRRRANVEPTTQIAGDMSTCRGTYH